MAVTIVVLSGDSDPLPSITFDAPRVVIGRGEGADVRLPDPSVSHRHASLRQRGSGYLVVDEGSTNGTYVGAVRLAPQSPRVVRSGDRIRVGRILLEVRMDPGATVTQSPQATRELALGLVSSALAAQGEVLAVEVEARTSSPGEAEAPASLVLDRIGREYVAGRGQTCDLVLDDTDCSRRHVGITRRGDGVFVRDLGSKNGTLLGGAPVGSDKERPWPAGSELRIGKTVLTYEDALAEALEELERSADEPVTGVPFGEATRAPARDDKPGSNDASDDTSSDPEDLDEAPPQAFSPRVARPLARPGRRALSPALTDFLVGTLAVLVLGLSLFGLYWLLSS